MGRYNELCESYQADIDRLVDSILALPDPTDEQRKKRLEDQAKRQAKARKRRGKQPKKE